LKNNFTFIDLFAGIGGFHLAMHRLGGECVFASEIDDFARQTYEINYKKISPKLFENNLFKYQDSNKRQILTQEFCIVISVFYRAMQRIVL
jgi:DNA (cytosine-5)-methyltransferase 1